MIDLSSTIREAHAASIDVHVSCGRGHEHKLDLQKLADLAGPLGRLDDAVLTKSWCPVCGMLANSFAIRT